MNNLDSVMLEVMDKIEKITGKGVPLHIADLRDKVAVKQVRLRKLFAYLNISHLVNYIL